MTKSELKELIKATIRESVLTEKLSPKDIEQLRKAYSNVPTINISSPAGKKVVEMLRKLSKDELKQIVDAKIKGISIMAQHRLEEVEDKEGSVLLERRAGGDWKPSALVKKEIDRDIKYLKNRGFDVMASIEYIMDSALIDIDPEGYDYDYVEEWLEKYLKTKGIRESNTKDGRLITEARTPDKSVYGAVGNAAMPDLLKILKKTVPSKYVKFRQVEAAGFGLWMIGFEGYTRSDLAINGWVSFAAPGGVIKSWTIDMDFTDAMKGKVEDSWTLMTHEDWTIIFTNVAKRLKQWVEM